MESFETVAAAPVPRGTVQAHANDSGASVCLCPGSKGWECQTWDQPLSRRQAHRLRDEQWPYDFGRLLEALAGYGILPYGSPVGANSQGPGLATQVKQALTTVRQYERTLQAPRRQAYMALASAVAMLRYSQIEEDLQAAQVRFTVYGRRITAKVVDAAPGYSSVSVEFSSLRTGAAVAGALLTNVFGLAAGAGAIAFDRRFAKGFLDNVQGVLEGRGVGEDSSLPPGLEGWRRKRRQVYRTDAGTASGRGILPTAAARCLHAASPPGRQPTPASSTASAPAGRRMGSDGSFTAAQIASATSSERVTGPVSPAMCSKTLPANAEYASGMATPCCSISARAFWPKGVSGDRPGSTRLTRTPTGRGSSASDSVTR